jgi:hypothetical protein
MNNEIEDMAEMEKARLQAHALIANDQTWHKFVKQIFAQPEDEEFSEEGFEWRVPESQEELDELTKLLEGR